MKTSLQKPITDKAAFNGQVPYVIASVAKPIGFMVITSSGIYFFLTCSCTLSVISIVHSEALAKITSFHLSSQNVGSQPGQQPNPI